MQVNDKFHWNPKDEKYFLVQLNAIEAKQSKEEALPAAIQGL